MFSIQHFIWLGICTALIAVFTTKLSKGTPPPIEKILNWCCLICILSEIVKILVSVEIVPSSDGSMYFPYIRNKHIPFHLCALQIFFIFIARFTKNKQFRDDLLAFVTPTAIVGASMAIIIATVFSNSESSFDPFIKPIFYQYFLFHTMLIILGLYILISKNVEFTKKRYFKTMALLCGLGFTSIYINSALGNATYVNGELVSVDYVTNFLFTFKTPIGIPLTEKWQWLLYIAIMAVLAFTLVGLFYIPALFGKKDNSAEQSKPE